MQGQTTLAERSTGASIQGFTCNLELVGQFSGEGANFSLSEFEKCVFYSTWPNAGLEHPGVTVLDVSDPRQPKRTANLTTPAALDPMHSVRVVPGRDLLMTARFSFNPMGVGLVELYDLATDCLHPRWLRSFEIPGAQVHWGEFSADGLTFYGAQMGTRDVPMPNEWKPPNTPGAAVVALDTRDVTNFRLLTSWAPPDKSWIPHSVTLNKEGTRAYVALDALSLDKRTVPSPNGLVILDVSEIKQRVAHPGFRLISTYFWDDASWAEGALLVTVRGRPHLIWSDLGAGIGGGARPSTCVSGRPTHGFSRIIDVGDEQHPKTVSKLMLEVQAPENCSKVAQDPTVGYGYGAAACDVDRTDDPRLLACGYSEAGLRVFDIRNLEKPREVAYYKPAARRIGAGRGSMNFNAEPKDHTADQVTVPRFRENGDIAFISLDNGFQIVRFSERLKKAQPDLFSR